MRAASTGGMLVVEGAVIAPAGARIAGRGCESIARRAGGWLSGSGLAGAIRLGSFWPSNAAEVMFRVSNPGWDGETGDGAEAGVSAGGVADVSAAPEVEGGYTFREPAGDGTIRETGVGVNSMRRRGFKVWVMPMLTIMARMGSDNSRKAEASSLRGAMEVCPRVAC